MRHTACERTWESGMAKFIVPFRMHPSGWLVLAFCVFIGIRLEGLRLGVLTGALLVASLLLHEVGHMMAAIFFEVPVREFGLRLVGAYNRRAYARRRRDEILISAAGPMMNLWVVFPLMFLPRIGVQLALCNLVLGVVNLVPLPASDGLRIVRTLRRGASTTTTTEQAPYIKVTATSKKVA
jgi:Zn-dependent protease